jgi:hypothetical protein
MESAVFRSLAVYFSTPLTSKLLQSINITFCKTCQLLETLCTDTCLIKNVWCISSMLQVVKSGNNSFLGEFLSTAKGLEKCEEMWFCS